MQTGVEIEIIEQLEPVVLDAGVIRFRRVIRNSGHSNAEISHIETGCGCTTAHLAKRHIQPGENTILTLDLDPAKARGNAFEFDWQAGIARFHAQCRLIGNVQDKLNTRAGEVVVRVSGDVELPLRINLPLVDLGTATLADEVRVGRLDVTLREGYQITSASLPRWAGSRVDVEDASASAAVINVEVPISQSMVTLATGQMLQLNVERADSTGGFVAEIPVKLHVTPPITAIPKQIILHQDTQFPLIRTIRLDVDSATITEILKAESNTTWVEVAQQEKTTAGMIVTLRVNRPISPESQTTISKVPLILSTTGRESQAECSLTFVMLGAATTGGSQQVSRR